MKTTTFIIILFCVFNNTFATIYPIAPRPLRTLVIESDAIIVGNVVSVYDRKYEGKKKKKVYYPEYKIAKIAVVETLQGKVLNDTIEIQFDPKMTCPSSDMYFEKTSAIVFLDIKNGIYSTHALSYGSKTLDSSGILTYKERISEIQKILEIKDSISQRTETVEWLVKCAENEATRWEGVFELHGYKEFSNSPDDSFKKFLSQNQKARLKATLLSSEYIGYYELELSDLIHDENSVEIDKFILDKLKQLPQENYYEAYDYIEKLKHLNTSAEMTQLLKKYYEIRLESDKFEQLNNIIREFITLAQK